MARTIRSQTPVGCCHTLLLLQLLLLRLTFDVVQAIHWDHSLYLNNDYRMLWSVKQQDITFEVQVRTAGYVGLGFSPDGGQFGADMAVGWIDQGQTYFQVRQIGGGGGSTWIMMNCFLVTHIYYCRGPHIRLC